MQTPRLQFTDFELDVATGELSSNGVTARLEPQPAALLAFLAANAGRLVTREELARVLWAEGTHVNFEDGVNYAIRRVRLALGDDARTPRFIETIPKRGYRFLAPVTRLGHASSALPYGAASGAVTDEVAATASLAGAAPGSRRSAVRMGVYCAVVIAAVFGLVAVETEPNRHHELTVSALKAVHDAIFSTLQTPGPASSANPQ